jgi:hypothetical protein
MAVQIEAHGTAAAGKKYPGFKHLLLHPLEVFLEAFTNAAVAARRMQEIETFEELMCQRMTALSFPQRLP